MSTESCTTQYGPIRCGLTGKHEWHAFYWANGDTPPASHGAAELARLLIAGIEAAAGLDQQPARAMAEPGVEAAPQRQPDPEPVVEVEDEPTEIRAVIRATPQRVVPASIYMRPEGEQE